MFEKLATEGRNPATLKIDRLSTAEMLQQINHEDQKVNDYYNYFHPGVLRLIKFCIDQSRQYAKYTAMCSEMAGDPEAIKILIALGLDGFSMNPIAIPAVKDIIRNVTLTEAKNLAEQMLQCQ